MMVCQQAETLLQRVVDNQASPEMFLLSLPQLLFSNLALFLIANCLRRGSASYLGLNLGQNLKSKISPLRIWCKATVLNADGGVTCSPLLYHHCLLEPEEISNNKVSNWQHLYEDCWCGEVAFAIWHWTKLSYLFTIGGQWHLLEIDLNGLVGGQKRQLFIDDQSTLLVDKIAIWCKLRILLCTNSASTASSPKDSARAWNNQWNNFCRIIVLFYALPNTAAEASAMTRIVSWTGRRSVTRSEVRVNRQTHFAQSRRKIEAFY